jgi:hypothetical protein
MIHDFMTYFYFFIFTIIAESADRNQPISLFYFRS